MSDHDKDYCVNINTKLIAHPQGKLSKANWNAAWHNLFALANIFCYFLTENNYVEYLSKTLARYIPWKITKRCQICHGSQLNYIKNLIKNEMLHEDTYKWSAATSLYQTSFVPLQCHCHAAAVGLLLKLLDCHCGLIAKKYTCLFHGIPYTAKLSSGKTFAVAMQMTIHGKTFAVSYQMPSLSLCVKPIE